MLNHFPSQIHFFFEKYFLKISASFRIMYYYFLGELDISSWVWKIFVCL